LEKGQASLEGSPDPVLLDVEMTVQSLKMSYTFFILGSIKVSESLQWI